MFVSNGMADTIVTIRDKQILRSDQPEINKSNQKLSP